MGIIKEIGGYIELDTYNLPMLHEGAIALNCGRNALAYVIKARNIRKIKLPYFLCNSVRDVCIREGVDISYYHVGLDFRPTYDEMEFGIKPKGDEEWLYFVNYYGQIPNEEIEDYVKRTFGRIIVDNAQSYFQLPVPNVDTLYTCRKYFGVADGAFLYTKQSLLKDAGCAKDAKDELDQLTQDESYERMHFLLGRYERTASEFYNEYVANNEFFTTEPIKKMSKLTNNLLRGIDYDAVKRRRFDNFGYLHKELGAINKLKNLIPGTFMYPLMIENGAVIRKKLQGMKIYIPTLWPDVFDIVKKEDLEYKMAEDILPLPIDQRYCSSDMENIIMVVNEVIA